MQWTPEAQDAIKKAPPFIRTMARKAVETYAKSRGMGTVTLDTVNEVRDKMMGRSSKKVETSEEQLNVGTNRRESMHLSNDRRFLARETDDPLHDAFDQKLAVHAMALSEPIADEELDSNWTDAIRVERESQPFRTLYIHIPFCQNHCLFCGFYQNANKKNVAKQYVDTLIDEISITASQPFVEQSPFQAVYFGGGTPTALAPEDLHRVVSKIKEAFPLTNDCEITLEGRFFDFGEAKASAAVDAGINRFSLGVQTFNTGIRRSVGRRQSGEDMIDTLRALNKSDRAAVVIDLIYGLPGQTMETWQKDIETYLKLDIDGCDLYQLNLFTGGPLDMAVKRGKLPTPASLRSQADFFNCGVEMMKAAHQRRLSLSHWAQSPRERSLYNTLSRGRSECVPLGAGAGGWLAGRFFFLDGKLASYTEAVKAGKKPVTMGLKGHKHNLLFRDISHQIELGYCDLKRLSNIHNVDVLTKVGPVVEQWERVGLIRLKDGCLYLHRAGEFWAVNLAQILIDILQM